MADATMKTAWEDLRLGYTESSGHPLLREAIASGYTGIADGDILTIVPEEGIYLLMHALLEPGDHVVCTFPGYQSLYEIPRSIGCALDLWEPAEKGSWRFRVEDLDAALRPETKLVIVNFPHNPTGFLPSREEFLTIVEAVRRQGAYLLCDEMYRLLETRPGDTLPAACEVYEKGISLSGLSKAYGLPGLRLGWLAIHQSQLLQRLKELKDYTTICGSAPSELLGIIALRNQDEILREQRARVSRNLEILTAFMQDNADCFTWMPPDAGSVCLPRVKVVEDTDAFCRQLVEEAGIMLLPSSQFQYGRNHVRIGFGREDLPQVLGHFGQYLEQRFRSPGQAVDREQS
jgi:aspartate/methionine/tyrosine aminotransferase